MFKLDFFDRGEGRVVKLCDYAVGGCSSGEEQYSKFAGQSCLNEIQMSILLMLSTVENKTVILFDCGILVLTFCINSTRA